MNQRGRVRALRFVLRAADERVDRTLVERRFLVVDADLVATLARLVVRRLEADLVDRRGFDERRLVVERRALLAVDDLRALDDRGLEVPAVERRVDGFRVLVEVLLGLRVVSVAVIACSQFLFVAG